MASAEADGGGRRDAGRSSGPGAAPPPLLLAALLAAMVVTAAPAEASASVIRLFSLAELQDGAAVIAAGRVASVRATRSAGRIVTEAIVEVERTWKGPERRSLRVRAAGGELAGERLYVAGAPTFRSGERVLVFLYRAAGEWRPVGMFQGVWRLDAGGLLLARPSPANGAELVALTPGPHAVELGPLPLERLVGVDRAGRERRR